MNRVLKQRFTQISRQNNFLLVTRGAPAVRTETTAPKMIPARPAPATEKPDADFRRG